MTLDFSYNNYKYEVKDKIYYPLLQILIGMC